MFHRSDGVSSLRSSTDLSVQVTEVQLPVRPPTWYGSIPDPTSSLNVAQAFDRRGDHERIPD